ncbi:hypothetical protein CKAN_01452300 [Cinnamomum micranthum f. kanehirae]|uniref:Transmembrane protein n=1 Tax=Cinnamomum micranthum f. kanehirae TaxID=337451 RepID=A0A443P4G6_9MAGN|nr:hypothetical protein CKAN_01452300 [Cinnamomum micranthum f. kanehirae]
MPFLYVLLHKLSFVLPQLSPHSLFFAVSVFFFAFVFLTQFSASENRPSITNIHPAMEDTEIVLQRSTFEKTFNHQHSTSCGR